MKPSEMLEEMARAAWAEATTAPIHESDIRDFSLNIQAALARLVEMAEAETGLEAGYDLGAIGQAVLDIVEVGNE